MRLSILLAFFIAACSGNGCGGCTSTPLPGGALPADQTVEGGGQVRISAQGFSKFSGLVQSLLLDAFGGGFCIPPDTAEADFGTDAVWCGTSPGGACGAGPGCDVDVTVDEFAMSAVNAQTFNLRMVISMDTVVHIDYRILWIGDSCDMSITANQMLLDTNVAVGIDAATGELTLNLAGINRTDFSGVNFDNCGILDEIGDLIFTLLDSFIGEFIIALLEPEINDLLQNMLPDPLGLEGVFDAGAAVASLAPGTKGALEVRLVPGGYANLQGGGLSLGLITGFNADEDPATRTPDLDNEPALCVPPYAAPNYAAGANPLPQSPRGTFTLLPAGIFVGQPELASDIGIGLSETMFDLVGHHIVSSGTMCMKIGPATLGPLNLATLSLLAPSIAELVSDAGNDPVMLALRPQRPVRALVGEGTATSPHLTLVLEDLEIDFYGFVYERYTRLFTASLTLNLGINLSVDASTNPATLIPQITGLEANDIAVDVINAEFVREPDTQIEAILPALLGQFLPGLGGALGGFALPDFGGFALANPVITRVQTSEDNFLAIYADLEPGMALRARAAPGSHLRAWVDSFPVVSNQPAIGSAAVRAIHMPNREALRAALLGEGQLPTVTLALSPTDANGRPIEWMWRLDNEIYRPWVRGPNVTISDFGFVSQGSRTIGLRARVIGDAGTLGPEVRLPVTFLAKPRLAETATEDDAVTGGCQSSHGGALGLVALVGVGAALALRRRRGAVALAVAAILVSGCGDNLVGGPTTCEVGTDCTCEAGFVGQCVEDTCVCIAVNPFGSIGSFSDIATTAAGDQAWVSAYAGYYGDLVVANVSNAGVIANEQWQWVDGVPDVAPSVPDSPVRGGIEAPGDDVGRYSSIAVMADGTPVVAYFSKTAGSLRFAAKRGDIWSSHVVDSTPDVDGGNAGRYASIAIAANGRIGITYLAQTTATAEVRYAEAASFPSSTSDWSKSVIDSAAVPPDSDEPDLTIPKGLGLFLDLTFDGQSRPVIAHYDRVNGDLRMVRRQSNGDYVASIVAGATDDSGWTPSVATNLAGTPLIAYVNSTNDDLMFLDTTTATPELVDDGYRIVGQTEDGLPKPEFHLVGTDASLLLSAGVPTIVYQDSTTHELLLATRSSTGWTYEALAGNDPAAPGAFGFFASAAPHPTSQWFSTWVIDLPQQTSWVQVFHPRGVE